MFHILPLEITMKNHSLGEHDLSKQIRAKIPFHAAWLCGNVDDFQEHYHYFEAMCQEAKHVGRYSMQHLNNFGSTPHPVWQMTVVFAICCSKVH